MQNKWYQLASWRSQDDTPGPSNGSLASSTPPDSARESTGFGGPAGSDFAAGGELMVFEEVYRSAGIRARASVQHQQVIEMLHSEHIRNLPRDQARVLLVALEAATFKWTVLQDATLRQRAINSYEAIQRKHLDEYEARKAQDNCTIQAEMERVAAEYAARISCNLDEVAREKDGFRKWQVRKQHEAQSIADAVALCVTPGKTSADPMSAFRELAATGDPAYVHRG
jgi:hypothetical protein